MPGKLIAAALVVLIIAAALPFALHRVGTGTTGQTRPTPVPNIPRGSYDTAKLFNGLSLAMKVEGMSSGKTAWETSTETNSYALSLDLHVRWPDPATNSVELEMASPGIRGVLPGLDRILSTAKVSPAFRELQARKERSLRGSLAALQHLPYRSSIFDCQTILEAENSETARRALLVQAVMNVNTDGSDGDRNLPVDRDSATFQPQTSYRWAKSGDRPNPFLPAMEARWENAVTALGSGTVTEGESARLKEERDEASAGIKELGRWSFLVGTADPFIVLPSFMVGKSPGQPRIGDYAVVIHNGTLYPAVLGDIGPNAKIGEASLRICRAIDPDAGGDKRPVSRPSILYVVFPGTAEPPFAAPDYGHWLEKCRALWREFGGAETSVWHEWTSLEKPWPTPTPSPSPVPSATAESSPVIGTNPAFVPLPPSTSVLPSSATNR